MWVMVSISHWQHITNYCFFPNVVVICKTFEKVRFPKYHILKTFQHFYSKIRFNFFYFQSLKCLDCIDDRWRTVSTVCKWDNPIAIATRNFLLHNYSQKIYDANSNTWNCKGCKGILRKSNKNNRKTRGHKIQTRVVWRISTIPIIRNWNSDTI